MTWNFICSLEKYQTKLNFGTRYKYLPKEKPLHHLEIFRESLRQTNTNYRCRVSIKPIHWDVHWEEVLIPLLSQRSNIRLKGNDLPNLKGDFEVEDYIHCWYCLTPRFYLVAIFLEASETTITICPLCISNLFQLPIHFNWKYAEEGYSI